MKRREAEFQEYGILPYRHARAQVSPLQEFTSAAIRRDSQYAFHGHENTVLWKGTGCNSQEGGLAVCRVCWMGHLQHAPLKRVLGGRPARLHKNSNAIFLNFKIRFPKEEPSVYSVDMMSILKIQIAATIGSTQHTQSQFEFPYSDPALSEGRNVSKDTSFQSGCFHSDKQQHLRYCHSVINTQLFNESLQKKEKPHKMSTFYLHSHF